MSDAFLQSYLFKNLYMEVKKARFADSRLTILTKKSDDLI